MQNHYSFVGGGAGAWRVTDIRAIRGPGLAAVSHIDVVSGALDRAHMGAAWVLRGFISNVRYGTRDELTRLRATSPILGRPEATRSALIPIRKSDVWWELGQDERRAIFEEASRHTAIGMEYIPAIARRLHHSRDLDEPFDFLTWFEFAPEHEGAFDQLVARLRSSPDWEYVERERSGDQSLKRRLGGADTVTRGLHRHHARPRLEGDTPVHERQRRFEIPRL